MNYSRIIFPCIVGLLLLGLADISAQVCTNGMLCKLHKNVGAVPSTPEYTFYIFGTGALKNALVDKSDDEDLINGTLGVALHYDTTHSLTVGFTINGLQNRTIENVSDFTTSIVVPDLGGNSVALDYLYYFKGNKHWDNEIIRHATKLSMVLTSNNWTVNSTQTVANQFHLAMQHRAVLFPYAFKNVAKGNNIHLYLDVGATFRFLFGDIALSQFDQLRRDVFGIEDVFFGGLQIDLGLVINTVTVGFSLPIFFTKEEIAGITGPKLAFRTAISGNMIKLTN